MQSSQPTMSAPEANTASMWQRTTTCIPAGSHTVKDKKQAKLRVHAASIGAHAAKLSKYHQHVTKLSVHAASVGLSSLATNCWRADPGVRKAAHEQTSCANLVKLRLGWPGPPKAGKKRLQRWHQRRPHLGQGTDCAGV